MIEREKELEQKKRMNKQAKRAAKNGMAIVLFAFFFAVFSSLFSGCRKTEIRVYEVRTSGAAYRTSETDKRLKEPVEGTAGNEAFDGEKGSGAVRILIWEAAPADRRTQGAGEAKYDRQGPAAGAAERGTCFSVRKLASGEVHSGTETVYLVVGGEK